MLGAKVSNLGAAKEVGYSAGGIARSNSSSQGRLRRCEEGSAGIVWADPWIWEGGRKLPILKGGHNRPSVWALI
jgi:hypothetical protein